ncbi:HD-GYP domain-containing protein [Catenulispora rubra]|uniref:HD-GYP domain-containing protein n=1 Tax=Catenulispora rubra TaxID=280293 RepID=UPI00189251D2|nr:HD-GYP domain-containing protein [Catenulispora rubra]
MPFSVRCYIFGLVAVAVSVIAALPLSKTDPALLLVMCVLVVAAERLSRVQIGVSGWTMSVSLVVTLITVLVLPPPAAALVGLVSAVPMPRQPSWTWNKQIVNSAMSSLVPASGSAVCHLAGGHAPGHFLNFPEFLWPAAVAVTTCLVVNALVIAGYVGLATHTRFVDALRGDIRRATMPYYSSGVLSLIFLSLWDDIGWYTAPLVVVPMYIAHWSLSQYAKEGAAHEGTIAALVQAVEIKDSYTRGHSERVARGAEMLAEQLKMPQDRLAMLRFAGLLHDIGKLGVPTRLLTSTGGLTEEEFKLMCMHPNHGVAVLRDIRFLTEVYEGVLYHHERLDGRGYPTGKSGDEIPEFARIIGVADAFDAMTSTRSYRAARSVEQAVAELRRGAGTQFDPALVQAFEAALQLAERSGRPWLPTELVPAEPPQDEATAAAATGPWPLPKRVPGFSFADHDDPFVPVEWFSDWYPSWLEHGGEPGPEDGTRPVPELLGGIPGQRVTEPEPEPAPEAGAESADFDDGWSERMHSAVVREAGPEPDEGWAWDGGAAEAALAEGGVAELAEVEAADTDSAAAGVEAADAEVSPDDEPGPSADPGPRIPVEPESPESRIAVESEADPELPIPVVPQPAADRSAVLQHLADLAAAFGSHPESDVDIETANPAEPRLTSGAFTRWPVDPGLRGDPRGSMRVRAGTPGADADPRGPEPAADFDLRKPVAPCHGVTGAVTELVVEPAAEGDETGPVHPLKTGDPEAWTPSPEPWTAPEPPAEASKAAEAAEAADCAEAESRNGSAAGPSWFLRGAGGSPPTLHFFGHGDAAWPPRDPDAKDSEESSA